MTFLLRKLDEARVGMMFLTRIPMGHVAQTVPLGRTAWAWPLAGLATGCAMAAGAGIGAWTGLPPMTGTILGMALSLWVTGGLHEDGLADYADGVGGGHDREKRLAIMRDSRIGSYGVLALIIILAMQAILWAAAGDMLVQALAVGLLSRACLPLWMALFTPARRAGMGRDTRMDLSKGGCAVACGLGVFGAFILVGAHAVPAALIGAVVQVLAFLAAKRSLGGFTGDVVGAAQVLGQTAVLAVLVQVQ